MKKVLSIAFALVMVLGLSVSTQAQQRILKGVVTAASDGLPLPGVTIVDKSTKSGTTTNADGEYSISVNENTVLVFSFIGFSDQEFTVGNQTELLVSLEEEASDLSEVVVTAFGMERDKKALGYSVTQLAGDRFTEARTANVGNALSGKVAGVNVTPPSTGAAGSSRVVIRGGSSLTGNDQPLYVVNGIPIESGNLGNAGMWGGNDSGDGLSSISPDDIESMSVLKGNAAAALYGARAANGVILITTKSGTARKGIGVSYSSNVMFDNVWDQTDFQRQYGAGRDGRVSNTTEEALEDATNGWGARYDGSSVIQFDGVSRPYSFTGEGLSDFYKTAYTFNNSIAFDGGNEMGNYRFSFSDLDNKDIMPNAGFKRRVANANINGKLGKFTLAVTGQFSNQKAKNRPRLSDAPGNANYAMLTKPGHIPLELMRGTTDKFGAKEDGTELRYQQSTFLTNPYWAAYQFYREDETNRILGNVSLKYDITDWLYVQGRLGLDFQSRVDHSSEPYGTAYKPLGDYYVTERTIREDNADLFIGFNKTFGDFDFDVFVGGNRMRRTSESLRGGGNDLVIPFFSSVRNVRAPSITYDFSEYGINSYFGAANIGYKNVLFFNATARQDQFSTLSGANSTLFYPSFSLSGVLSDMFTFPEVITFAKVRGSWGQAGGGAPNPYALNLTYGLVGAGHLGGNLGQIQNESIPNSNLGPYTSTEYEIGADLRFFENRVGLDVAYYNRTTKDDILATGISGTSGFNTTTINIGELRNKGFEFLLNITPIARDFKWDISFNFANNVSEVLSLGTNSEGEAIEFINLGNSRLQRESIRHIVGEPLGMIAGFKQLEINGQKVYDDNGYPVATDGYETIAQGRHPISAGFSNTFSYKGFRMYFLIDVRSGGYMMSGTNSSAYSRGLHENTLVGRDGGLTISGVNLAGEPMEWIIPANPTNPEEYLLDQYYQRYAQITENVVYDASFAKLREFTFGYTFPAKVISKTPLQSLTLSFVGRNLALLWSNVPNVDPESAYANDGNSQGLEYFGLPTNRSFGFNLSANF
ncbi:TonB-linked SusC/RagA family outer membrane protein [Algoriphagus sp. 4150]|uniref:SusC/RagA family TonB-linked outer membrane protein n=1 Tax=Algoriphagus sp. 4150 TaxID=2817756 RepID=UPI002864F0FD|nr:SusC/RagA family TonB-linked outer membrane protein [Algoriphagus sp. 4150]MDR7131084.1 TonB-linked SusC/RagA family outer membrane protein [Algoriphagus sp. 4150]